jgi:hypothetical protein
VINFGGVRIGGVSGIWSGADFRKGHFEKPPYRGLSELKSAYHVREYDCFRLKQLQQVRPGAGRVLRAWVYTTRQGKAHLSVFPSAFLCGQPPGGG